MPRNVLPEYYFYSRVCEGFFGSKIRLFLKKPLVVSIKTHQSAGLNRAALWSCANILLPCHAPTFHAAWFRENISVAVWVVRAFPN